MRRPDPASVTAAEISAPGTSAMRRPCAACAVSAAAAAGQPAVVSWSVSATTSRPACLARAPSSEGGVVPSEAARGCGFCAARLRHQCEVLEEFRRRFKKTSELFLAPERPVEVRGPERLREHFDGWRRLKGKK